MKLKARDIIPGWPKSGSTMPCHDDWRVQLGWFGLWDWNPGDILLIVGERKLSLEYHARQQRIVSQWRKLRFPLAIRSSITALPPSESLPWYMTGNGIRGCGKCGARWKRGEKSTCACPPDEFIGWGYEAASGNWRAVKRFEGDDFCP